ncbi:MAG: lasso peptide biosynthesis B2 protein [Gammaproteobacteria bacterium]|nr:lasso peptide biosynthesis B2 protein [Gammaproteobacteria bacterium]
MQLQAVKKLSFSQWCRLIEAYWRLWPVLLKIRFGRTAWLIDKLEFARQAVDLPKTSLPPLLDGMTRSMHEAVRLAARCHFWHTACLPRSLVLADMLNRRGLEASVRIGVSRSTGADSSLASHAWVEVQGCIVGEPETISEQFTRIVGKTPR